MWVVQVKRTHPELHDVDPNVLKLFQIAQMIIEFLLHSQNYLLKQRDHLTSEIEELKIQNINSKESEKGAVF
jgi:hypothetical protein